jgi:arsenate reductase (thioredoxin)
MRAVLRPDHLSSPLLRRLCLMADRLVLFICVENACRSLMAEAMFNADPPGGWRAVSAGTRPADGPNPRAAAMLSELGLVLPNHPPQLLTEELDRKADRRVTMGCLDESSCPVHLKEHAVTDWALPDPAALGDAEFRQVRDGLRDRVRRLRLELVVAD